MTELEVFAGGDVCGQLKAFLPVYERVYADPPYSETGEDVAEFAAGWERRCAMAGIRLVLARQRGEVIGFTFGHPLPPGTRWWSGLLDDVPSEVTGEWPGRTFAVIELAVLPEHRRTGVARQLHDALLAGQDAERVTLLVRPEPEALPARSAYQRWGYQRVGRVRPYDEAPVYEAMVLPLAPDRAE